MLEVKSDELLVTLKQPRAGETRFVVRRVEPALANDLDHLGVPYFSEDQTSSEKRFTWLAAAIGALGLFYVFSRRRGVGGTSAVTPQWVGKSNAKVYVETDTRVSFSDVAGVDEAKHELQEIVAFLREVSIIPRGIGALGYTLQRPI